MKKLWNWIYLNTGIGFLISTWEVHNGRVIVDEITYYPSPTTQPRKWRFL